MVMPKQQVVKCQPVKSLTGTTKKQKQGTEFLRQKRQVHRFLRNARQELHFPYPYVNTEMRVSKGLRSGTTFSEALFSLD